MDCCLRPLFGVPNDKRNVEVLDPFRPEVANLGLVVGMVDVVESLGQPPLCAHAVDD